METEVTEPKKRLLRAPPPRLQRFLHHGARGARRRPQAARDVHRLHRQPRPAPPRLRGRRQLRRRSARRHCKNIDVTIHLDNSITVLDDGRGIPVDIMEKRDGRPPRSCSPSSTRAASSTTTATRFQAVFTASASPASTRSRETLDLEIYRGGKAYHQLYKRGDPQMDLAITVRPNAPAPRSPSSPTRRSSRSSSTASTCSQPPARASFLNAGLHITLQDERSGKGHDFHYEGGIKSFVEHLNKNKTAIHDHPSTSSTARTASSWRSRCSGTAATTRRSSRSRTTSIRTRVAPTSSASRARSPAP